MAARKKKRPDDVRARENKSGRPDSNRRPSAPKADAIPGYATPRSAEDKARNNPVGSQACSVKKRNEYRFVVRGQSFVVGRSWSVVRGRSSMDGADGWKQKGAEAIGGPAPVSAIVQVLSALRAASSGFRSPAPGWDRSGSAAPGSSSPSRRDRSGRTCGPAGFPPASGYPGWHLPPWR